MQHSATSFARFLIAFEDQAENDEATELIIPEDLSTLSDEDLETLSEQAIEAFNALYGDGQNLSDEDVAQLASLTEGIEAVNAQISERAEASAARAEQAAELAARIRPAETEEAPVEETAEVEETPADDTPAEETAEVEEPAEAIAASGRGDVRVSLSTIRARSRNNHIPRQATEEPGISNVLRSVNDEGMDWSGVGAAIDRSLLGFNASAYENAARRGRHMREQNSIATIQRQIPDEFRIKNGDPDHIEEVIQRAVDQARLPQGSLVASGGWCAPSEVTYGMLELESNDGLFSAPEIGINRGGISFTQGVDFSEIFSGTGFSYSEQEDIDGDYDGEGGGTKPCFRIPCPTFEEERLRVAGLCLTAGLLQQKGYPEVIARTVRGAMVAHAHRVAGEKINAVVAGSTAVTMPSDQVGATAPILAAIELQVQHYRYVHRMSENATLEAVFPYWVRGAIRSDLSRRLGVDLISVNDARITQWFAERGVAAQFVYNYQDITGDANAFTGWAAEVKFLLYAAGTWTFGGSDVISLDTIYDSVNLSTNDYTALFTEEAWLPMKRFSDSREITVPICSNGATAGGVLIDCDGSAGGDGSAGVEG